MPELNAEVAEDTLIADPGEDTVEAAGEDTLAAEEPGDIVITIEGEEPEPDEDAEIEAELGEKGRNAVRALREAKKKDSARIRELEASLAEKEAASKPPEDELGPRPVIADYGFNDDQHAEALLQWAEKKRVLDAKREAEKAAQKAELDAYQEKLARYHADRTKVGVDDDAQAIVVAALSPQQQSALMDASLDPAKVVAALSKTPKVLAELAGIKAIHKFTYKLAQIEGKIQMTTKAPPPPESKLRGGAATVDATSRDPLEKLREKAQDSGDWSSYFSEKRRREAAGVKA